MPVFATLLINIVGAVMAWFARRVAARYAFFLAAVAAVVVAWGVMASALEAILAGIEAAAPPILATVTSWFVPGNLSACIAARIAAELAVSIYHWQMNITLRAATGVA